MKQTIMKTTSVGRLGLTVVAACWIATGTVQACSPRQSVNPAAHNRALANLRLTLPPALTATRDTGRMQSGLQAHDNPVPTIVGLWMKTYTAQGQVVDMGFDTFNDDGNEMIVDISPPVSDNVCTGVWRQTDSFTYSLYHISFTFDMDGNANGTFVFQETMTISPDGNSFTGTSILAAYDVTGALIDGSQAQAQIGGTRIKPI